MVELNFNATIHIPMQPEEQPNDYAVWKEICSRMDREVIKARLAWRESVQKRDHTYRLMKEASDQLRFRCEQLEARQKPPFPRQR